MMMMNMRSSISGLSIFKIHCFSSSDSTTRRRGFGDNNNTNNSNNNNNIPIPIKKRSKGSTTQPLLLDLDFDQRLEAVTRSALEQKKSQQQQQNQYGPIDYDTPIISSPTNNNNKEIGFATKIGVGVAVLLFGLVFTLGDFIPSQSVSPNEDNAVVKLSEEDKATLQSRLKEFEATLSNSPTDPTALEGAAVTQAQLGEYAKAASLLQDLTKEKPNDADVFRLLGEVNYELKDYEGSVAAYKSSATVSKDIEFEVVRGLTNSLLAAKKPDEAVQFLLACRERLSSEILSKEHDSSPTDSQKLDPIQVELLLGKAYSDWGHVSDAVAVYDQLISTHPDDFRGYLAKGIILKENKNIGDAERMFIQARFFAPDKAKALVDRYSR
ncbi:hypothetical protein TanjilG_24467 [Lupinus angustifolius]|uniref:Uncharacterized protein n=1 Tax=Lupinus angustifolius TaxID=3871 RepID=A0A1J7HWW4_LUPAN|nr:PREDICTED: uncharacterized protein LOC109357276 isoform X2 [Lupinus angustifolius]OIW04995.1 hypothetical protein TanjilG_24467 [Lupinus angustifolius]